VFNLEDFKLQYIQSAVKTPFPRVRVVMMWHKQVIFTSSERLLKLLGGCCMIEVIKGDKETWFTHLLLAAG
jgi:hypothetical protein